MLAFSFCDAHFHLVPFLEFSEPNFFQENDTRKQSELLARLLPKNFCYSGISCAHAREEFESQERVRKILISSSGSENFSCIKIFPAFGMHPQNPLVENASLLEHLLQSQKIVAVGEAGFDFFPEYKNDASRQEEAWRVSVELAVRYNAALIVHARKSMHKIFADTKLLRKARAVVFHSFMGSPREATAFLERGVNAYFSFGKPLLQGKKSATACVAELPLERLLLETDAPWQTLKGEKLTPVSDIEKVYRKAVSIRNERSPQIITLQELAASLAQNFQVIINS